MRLKNYIITVAILAAGCASYLGISNFGKKSMASPTYINNSIEDKLEEECGIELTKELNGHQLPANEMYITSFSLPNGRGAFHIRNVDNYYFAMRFDYVNLNKKMGCEYDWVAKEWWRKNHPNDWTRKLYDSNASRFWKNKKVLVYNPKNGKAAVCVAQDWGPAAFVVRKARKQIIDASHKTIRYLFGTNCSGWSSKNLVYTYLLENQNIRTGPISF